MGDGTEKNPARPRILVIEAPDRLEHPEVLGRWEFSPYPRSERRRDDGGRFRDGLLSALRAGHGLGVSFRIRLDSGPEPILSLAVDSAVGHRWVVRTLAGVYGPSRWTRAPSARSATDEGSWRATRLSPWPNPLRLGSDGESLTDVLALSASALPRGVWLELRGMPLPPSSPSWWETLVHDPTRIEAGVDSRVSSRSSGPHRTDRTVVHPDARPGVPLFWAVRATVGSDLRDPDQGTVRGAARTFERASRGRGGNGLSFRPRRSFVPWRAPDFPVSDDELALVFPGMECPSASSSRRSHPDRPRLPLGRSRAGTALGPEIEPLQGRHLAVLGETGMGKSSLLVSLAARAARTTGLVLFDPLGETAEAFAREAADAGTSRIVRIDPGRHPLRINALEGVRPSESDPVRSERRLNDLVHALRRVRAGRYVDSAYWGPRLEEMLTRALLAAAAFDHGTLSDAHTLLATGARTHRDLPSAAMGPVRELGDRIREHPLDAEGARRLLYEVVRSPVLERMLCARDPEIRPRDLVAPGRVVILSGSASQIGESTARYLLSTYLALLWSELLSRRDRAKTFVVLDEAQWFSHESLAEMLRLGRRANVHVVLATQAVASLPESVQEAVWTNVADFVAFRGSPEEAREFARVAHGIAPETILSLPRGEAAMLLGKGQAVEWIRSARLPERAERSEAPGGRGPEDPPEVLEPADPGPTSDPPSGSAGPVEAGPEETIFRRLRALAAASGCPAVLRVPLSELRRPEDPGERAVRAAGSVLGRLGALGDAERTGEGKVWLVAVDRIPPPPSATPVRLPSDAAGAPKLS